MLRTARELSPQARQLFDLLVELLRVRVEATGAASSPDAASLCALLRHCPATHIDLTSSLDAPTRLALLALLRDEARAEGHERQVSHPFMASGKSKPPVLVFWLRFEKSRPPGTSAVLLL